MQTTYCPTTGEDDKICSCDLCRRFRIATRHGGSIRVVALLLFLVALPVFAQDQTLEPDATVSETNSDCTTSNAHTRNSDNSDSTFCDGGTGSPAESYELVMGFPTPSANPSTSTDAQEFQCRLEKSDTTAGNGDPTATFDLFCGGVEIEAGGTTHTVTGAMAEFSELFTFGGACASNGSDVEIRVQVVRAGGSPGGRRSIDTADCDWDVTHASSGRRLFVNTGGGS